MRWLHNLFALLTCLFGIVWAFYSDALDVIGLPGVGAGDFARAGPFVVIALGIVSLLAANIRTRGSRGDANVEILFDPRQPGYVEHDEWRDHENQPLPGMAYRIGIRNKTRATLHDVIVVATVEDARPATSRFLRHKTYYSDIGPHETELVELFMLSDRDIANHLKVVQTVKVRASSAEATGSSCTFKFDNQAAIPLVRV